MKKKQCPNYYRAFTFNANKYVYGELHTTVTGACFLQEKDQPLIEVDAYTLDRYTGRIDADGNKIYESDMLRITKKEHGFERIYALVVSIDSMGYSNLDCYKKSEMEIMYVY
mgnify:FL=1